MQNQTAQVRGGNTQNNLDNELCIGPSTACLFFFPHKHARTHVND